MVYRTLVYVTLLFLLLVASCTKKSSPTSNPLDPDTDDYEVPMVSVVTDFSPGAIVNTSVVNIELIGNDLVTEYRYKLDNFSWADWSESPFVVLDYLDEGGHSVQVQSRYISGEASEIASISFTVNAVPGPSLIFYPRRAFASVNDVVTFQILAEEVEDLAGLEFVIGFESTRLTLESVAIGTIFEASGAPLFFSDQPNQESLKITSAVWGQDSPSFSGTGPIASVSFRVAQSGEIGINFEGDQIFRDSNNLTINIQETVPGIITNY